jgi:hypothetical protein
LALLASLQVRPLDPELLMPLILTAGLIVVTVAVCSRMAGWTSARRWLSPMAPAWLLVLFGLLVSGNGMVSELGRGPLLTSLLLAVLVGACVAAGLPRQQGRDWPFWGFVCLAGGLAMLHVARSSDSSDVLVAVHDASRALLAGHDPYAITLPNPYGAGLTEQYYSPDVLVGGRLDFGFPYLPAALLGYLPGYLLGDVRFASVVALVLVAVLLRRLARDEVGRVVALVPLTLPLLPLTLEMGWVEPVVALFLVWTVSASVRGSRMRSGLALGCFLASKQYLVVVLPLLLPLARRLGRGVVIAGLGVATLLVLAFAAWGPTAFVRSVVELHLNQPYRPDSVSLAVAWGNTFGRWPAWTYGLPPLMAGLAVSSLVAWRSRPGPASFSLGMGLSLLATVLLSKQAYGNYYMLIEIALVLGVVTWGAGWGGGSSSDEEVVAEPSGTARGPELVVAP